MRKSRRRGQAIVEYILMSVMIAFIIAATIRGTGVILYSFWSALASVVAAPAPPPPGCAPGECLQQKPPTL